MPARHGAALGGQEVGDHLAAPQRGAHCGLGLATLAAIVLWKQLHQPTWSTPDLAVLFSHWGSFLR